MSVFESKTVPDETLHEDAVVETISEDEKIAVTVAPKAQWWSYIWVGTRRNIPWQLTF